MKTPRNIYVSDIPCRMFLISAEIFLFVNFYSFVYIYLMRANLLGSLRTLFLSEKIWTEISLSFCFSVMEHFSANLE